jgi:hypothetical protein
MESKKQLTECQLDKTTKWQVDNWQVDETARSQSFTLIMNLFYEAKRELLTTVRIKLGPFPTQML